MRPTLIALVVLGAAAPACKRTPPPPPLPECRDGLSREDLLRLRRAAQSGKDPCPDLATPKLVLDATGVSVDGKLVVPPAELPTNRPQNIAPLFQALQGRVRLWKQLHAGETFVPSIDVTAAPDADAVAGASVVRTVAWAGFTRFHLTSGDIVVDFDYATPRPPGAPTGTIEHVQPTGNFHDMAKAIADEVAKAPKDPITFDRGS